MLLQADIQDESDSVVLLSAEKVDRAVRDFNLGDYLNILVFFKRQNK